MCIIGPACHLYIKKQDFQNTFYLISYPKTGLGSLREPALFGSISLDFWHLTAHFWKTWKLSPVYSVLVRQRHYPTLCINHVFLLYLLILLYLLADKSSVPQRLSYIPLPSTCTCNAIVIPVVSLLNMPLITSGRHYTILRTDCKHFMSLGNALRLF